MQIDKRRLCLDKAQFGASIPTDYQTLGPLSSNTSTKRMSTIHTPITQLFNIEVRKCTQRHVHEPGYCVLTAFGNTPLPLIRFLRIQRGANIG